MYLIFGVIFGILCAAIARSRGRNAVGWFFCGFLIGLIGLIILCVLPNRKEELARQEFADREQQRLREQLRQERLKGESFRQYTMGRLDSHDNLLGVDTRTAQTALPGMEADNPQLENLQPGSQIEASSLRPMPGSQPDRPCWYYEDRGQSSGPVTADEIRAMVISGQLLHTNLVWAYGMIDWQQIRVIPEFQKKEE